MNSNFVIHCLSPQALRLPFSFLAVAVLAIVIPGLAGCRHAAPDVRQRPPAAAALVSTNQTAATQGSSTNKPAPLAKRFTYTPRPYPVDERGFSPVDKALAKAYAREDLVADDAEGSLNPYVLKVVSAYPLDGSYPYHCGWKPREYDIYNGVTQDLWYRGMVVAKAYPDGSRCSYCCGFTFEAFVRAMKLRNIQKGLDPDDFNGMTFGDLFNMLQLWYIEGDGDSEQRGITSYGLGRAIADLEEVRPGDFLSYSTTPAGGHSVIFIDWIRDEQNKIVGLKYFSSNLSGTHGVGYGSGRFSDSNANGRGLLRKSLRIARVGAHQGLQALRSRDDSATQRLRAHPARPDYVSAGPGSDLGAHCWQIGKGILLVDLGNP